MVNQARDVRLDGADLGARGNPGCASLHHLARFLRAFLGTPLIATGANELVNFEAAEVRAFLIPDIAEDFFGDGLDNFFELLLIHLDRSVCGNSRGAPANFRVSDFPVAVFDGADFIHTPLMAPASAARAPGTLFAAMEEPIPAVSITMPRQASPRATALATASA